MAGPSQLSPSVTASAVLADIFFLHVHARDKSNHASVLAGIRWETMECRKMKVMYTLVQGGGRSTDRQAITAHLLGPSSE